MKYNKIGSIINRNGLTYNIVSKKLKVEESTVMAWCANKKQPSLKSLYKLAKMLGFSVCQLLN